MRHTHTCKSNSRINHRPPSTRRSACAVDRDAVSYIRVPQVPDVEVDMARTAQTACPRVMSRARHAMVWMQHYMWTVRDACTISSSGCVSVFRLTYRRRLAARWVVGRCTAPRAAHRHVRSSVNIIVGPSWSSPRVSVLSSRLLDITRLPRRRWNAGSHVYGLAASQTKATGERKACATAVCGSFVDLRPTRAHRVYRSIIASAVSDSLESPDPRCCHHDSREACHWRQRLDWNSETVSTIFWRALYAAWRSTVYGPPITSRHAVYIPPADGNMA